MVNKSNVLKLTKPELIAGINVSSTKYTKKQLQKLKKGELANITISQIINTKKFPTGTFTNKLANTYLLSLPPNLGRIIHQKIVQPDLINSEHKKLNAKLQKEMKDKEETTLMKYHTP